MLYCKLCKKDLTDAVKTLGSVKSVKAMHEYAHIVKVLPTMCDIVRAVSRAIPDEFGGLRLAEKENQDLAKQCVEVMDAMNDGIFEED